MCISPSPVYLSHSYKYFSLSYIYISLSLSLGCLRFATESLHFANTTIHIFANDYIIKNLIVCLQFPEGLMMFGCLISDILENFAHCVTVIMGDVTYGACCIDDITTKKLGADLLIHYGHSCLVPITDCCTKILYVFVEINIDMTHFRDTVLLNFEQKSQR